MSERLHHPHSPSSLQSSEACPAFLNEDRESEAAAAGTLQHTAVETKDLTVLHGDEEMEAAVSKAIEYENAVLAEFRLSGERIEVVREKYLQVGDEVVLDAKENRFPGVTGGFPDTVIVGTKRGAILDWKFGRVAVSDTRDNLQGIAYALGAFQSYPQLDEISVHFFAPYQKWSDEEQRRKFVHRFHRREIPVLELRVRAVIAKKQLASAQIAAQNWTSAAPKSDLCLWCARKAECPKIHALIRAASNKYHDLVVPDEVKEYRLDTPDRVAQAYRFAGQLQTICEAVKKRCTDAAVTEDLLPPGFTIVKSSRREVTSTRRFVEIAIDNGLSEDEAVELLNVPITKFETALKEKAPRGTGAPKVRAFAAALEEAGATRDGKPFYFLRESRTPAEKSDRVIEISSRETKTKVFEN